MNITDDSSSNAPAADKAAHRSLRRKRAADLAATRILPLHLVVGLRVEGLFDEDQWYPGSIESIKPGRNGNKITVVHYEDSTSQTYDSHNATDMHDLRYAVVHYEDSTSQTYDSYNATDMHEIRYDQTNEKPETHQWNICQYLLCDGRFKWSPKVEPNLLPLPAGHSQRDGHVCQRSIRQPRPCARAHGPAQAFYATHRHALASHLVVRGPAASGGGMLAGLVHSFGQNQLPCAARSWFSRFIPHQRQKSFAKSKITVGKIGQRESLFVRLTNSNFTFGGAVFFSSEIQNSNAKPRSSTTSLFSAQNKVILISLTKTIIVLVRIYFHVAYDKFC